jgi:hypothetical protein
MRKLDRLIISWAKGNARTFVGPYLFTTTNIFHEGVPIAVRIKDMGGTTAILVRDTMLSGSKLDNTLEPERHFKGRKWCKVSTDEFHSIPLHLSHIREARASASNGFNRDSMLKVGVSIEALRFFSTRHDFGLQIFDEGQVDKVVLGALFTFRGKFAAFCSSSKYDQFGRDCTKYELFHSFDEAVLFKMKNDNVKLYDLSQ